MLTITRARLARPLLIAAGVVALLLGVDHCENWIGHASAGVAASPPPQQHLTPANATDYVFVDNYGGNSNGYLTDTGPGHQVRACHLGRCPGGAGADGWFPVLIPGSHTWFLLQSTGNDCAHATSTHAVFAGKCLDRSADEWRFRGSETIENRRFTTWLTAGGILTNGVKVWVRGGRASGENQWASYPVNGLKHSPAEAVPPVRAAPSPRLDN